MFSQSDLYSFDVLNDREVLNIDTCWFDWIDHQQSQQKVLSKTVGKKKKRTPYNIVKF